MIHFRDPFPYFCDPFCPKFRAPKYGIIIMRQGEVTNDNEQLSTATVNGLEETNLGPFRINTARVKQSRLRHRELREHLANMSF